MPSMEISPTKVGKSLTTTRSCRCAAGVEKQFHKLLDPCACIVFDQSGYTIRKSARLDVLWAALLDVTQDSTMHSSIARTSKPCVSLVSGGVGPRIARQLNATYYQIKNRSKVSTQASGGIGDFFKKNSNDQEAAQKALQDAFKDKKDPWALDEERARKKGGNGGGGGGRGGGGGFGGGFSFNDWGDGFMKWIKGTLKAIAAALCFFGFILAFTFWEPLLRFMTTIVRTVLRLDVRKAQVAETATAADADLTNKGELGHVEEAVISQWAGDEHPDVGISDDDVDE